MNPTMTYHCAVERANRVQNIINTVGLGQIIKESYIGSCLNSWQAGNNRQAGKYICITDTGIIIVKDELREKIITMYVATYKDLLKLYNGSKIPKWLHKKVDRNQTFYTENGKTIWR